ncbi:MAG: septum site-determining protein MinC [Peptococcaceae bacterium BRH_c4a]|nr:MAG: septum site-determining protein MinC [Peptococcaceae bacterium BRH_c4a]
MDSKRTPNGPVSDEIEGDENTILIRRTLRSGQKFYYNGNVIIMGDVNPGAQVAATGNIIVMGQMRGVVHAGAEGDEAAMVMAFRLLPTQLRIANHITRPPDDEVPSSTVPEIARIKNGVVTIESYPTGLDRVFR